MTTIVKEVGSEQIHRIGEIDRSETVEAKYNGELLGDRRTLTLRRIEIDPPQHWSGWDAAGVEWRAAEWKAELDKGGLMLGAFRDGQFVGFAVLGPQRKDGSAEVHALFVHAAHRRHRIGSLLWEHLEQHARGRGVKALLIYSNRSASAVEFYISRGCRIVALADKSLVRQIRLDVIFAKAL